MGSNRRRRRRRRSAAQESAPPAAGAAAKSGWRATIDSWGGFTVIGSLAAAVIVIGVLVIANLPGSDIGDDEWIPTERSIVDGRTTGDPAAPVKMVEFADFQCPFCEAYAHNIAPTLLEEYVETGQVLIEYRYFSFLGPESFAAAEAAECANDQGYFWDYHDILFLRQGRENSGVYSTGNLKDFARELQAEFPEFDLGEFDECVDSGRHEATVELERDQAAALGVNSTPSFLINGQAFANTQSVDAFRNALDAAITTAESS